MSQADSQTHAVWYGYRVAFALAAILLLTLSVLAASAQSASGKRVKIAMLVGATTNAYQSASIDEAKKAAKRLNADITVFDANFDPAKQIAQMEDVIALGTGRFNAIALFPIDNIAPITVVKKAVAAGFKVGVSDAVLGPRLDTNKVQVKGVVVQASPVWSEQGKKLGKLIVAACRGIDPCKVGWVGGLKIWPPEGEMLKRIEATIKPNRNIDMSTRVGDTYYTREGGLKVIGTLIQSKPDLNVIVAADQALLGAEPALKDAGLFGKVKLVGLGGTLQSKQRIASGTWFGTVAQAPRAEGRIVVEGLVAAIRAGKVRGGVDTASLLVGKGVITKANVRKFKPEFSG